MSAASTATTTAAATLAAEVSGPPPPLTGRLVSLDVFRGITIAAMLLVNNPGTWSAIYPPLRHAEWHGWTPTDLIFPFFLYIVGVAMVFSFAKQRRDGAREAAMFRKVARRAAVLVLLGLLLHSFPWIGYDYGSLRIPGVLQRIGVAYLLAGAVVLWLGPKGRAAVCAGLLLGYWAVMSWVPVPGIGAGVLEPGQDPGAFLDRAIFGTDHLWAQARTWDPEGLLSTMPAVATVLLGVFNGEWLRSARSPGRTTAGMLAAGALAVAAGLMWGAVFPINKPLWTSSYVVFTAGAAALALAACYWVVDVKERRRWAFPFVLFGVNAIAAFWLSSAMARVLNMIRVPAADGDLALKTWIYRHGFESWLAPVNASLAFALCFVGVWTLIMGAFYRRRIFLKV